jgi:ADP-heptose:LPS heptosyltransferase
MEPCVYRKKWLDLRKGPCSAEAVSRLSRQVALSFVDHYYQNGRYEAEYIALLCEMATAFSDMELNSAAASALFEIIVEKLCDDFEDMLVEVYNRVMCQVISYCRTIPQGADLDKKLTGFGLLAFEDLCHRANLIQNHKYTYSVDKPPEKVILLSRVTIGADVAILSVMIQRLMKIFPQAEFVIIGSAKLQGLFGGNPQIRICPLTYPRLGGLFERFSSWHGTLEILGREMSPDRDHDILLIDPDSRISQLGLLPLTHGENYLFFNSRTPASSSEGACMAELANYWVDSVFGTTGFSHPRVWIPSPVRLKAQDLTASLRAAGCRRIITVNFGVGTNPRKRVGIEFEKRLLREIIAHPETVVLLDRGFGGDELAQSATLLSHIRNQGFATAEVRFEDSECVNMSHGIVGLACTVGEIAAVIAECNEFIGYDSACQHIATAAGTPTLTIFAGSNNVNFVRRWSAHGDTPCTVVHVDTLSDPQNMDIDALILRIMEERIHLRSTTTKPGAKRREIRALAPAKKQTKEIRQDAFFAEPEQS